MTPHQRYTKRLQWFKSRIGKRVYRNYSCHCPTCHYAFWHGIIIEDNLHATYLRDCEADMELHYADTKVGVWWWMVKRWFKYWIPYLPIAGVWILEIMRINAMRDTCIRVRHHWWISLCMHIIALAYIIYIIHAW